MPSTDFIVIFYYSAVHSYHICVNWCEATGPQKGHENGTILSFQTNAKPKVFVKNILKCKIGLYVIILRDLICVWTTDIKISVPSLI